MRRRIEETILPVFITIIVTFSLQLAVEYFTRPSGVYSIELFNSENKSTGHISIDNRTNKIHDELYFLVENSENLKILTKDYLEYQLTPSSLDSSKVLLKISNILPQSKTNIILANLSTQSQISFVNSKDKQYRDVGFVISRHFNALRNAIITTLIYGLIFGLFYIYFIYIFNRQVERQEKHAEESKERVKELKDELKDVRENISKSNASSLKRSILYMAKIRDYEKELNFWKTLISKILYEDKNIKPKELFKKITETLESYGTVALTDEKLSMAEYISKITKE